nr:hypothetical protein [candidate division Zixibacteria bacterium]
MAEKNEGGAKQEQEFDPEKRFKYVGFEVYPGKIKDLFKSEAEKDKLVAEVREKRKGGLKLREKTTFDIPRLAGYEKVILTITSLMLVVSLFLPWFSGYNEVVVQNQPMAAAPAATPADSLAMVIPEDSLTMLGGDSATVPAAGTAEVTESPTTVLEKDERGFSSITSSRKRVEIRKEHKEATALGALGYLGEVLSSGFILKITGILFLLYLLFCVFGAIFTLYILYGIKGDLDTKAIRLKRGMRFGWIPVGIWALCLLLSFGGASYSFPTANIMVQIGDSYGVGTYLGILGYGFYLSLACFIMNAVKAMEI